jgi:hypothetical protein
MKRCPHCNNPLTSDEEREANCPACGGSLSTGVTAKQTWQRESRPEPLPEEESFRETYRDVTPASTSLLGWASVRTSFTIFVTGWLLIQGSMLVTLLIEGAALRMGPPPGALLVLLNLFSLAIIAGVVHFLTGMCMALAVPSESSAKGWGIGIILSLALSLAAIMIATGSFRLGGDPGLGKVLGYAFLGGLFLAKILYTGFVFGVARHYGLSGLSIAILVYLALELAMFTWIFIRSVTNEPFRQQIGPLDDIFGTPGKAENRWIMIAVSTVMCAWFVSMVIVVRGAITRSLLRR